MVKYDTGICLDVSFLVGLPHITIDINSNTLINACPIFTNVLFDENGHRNLKKTIFIFEDFVPRAFGLFVEHIYNKTIERQLMKGDMDQILFIARRLHYVDVHLLEELV